MELNMIELTENEAECMEDIDDGLLNKKIYSNLPVGKRNMINHLLRRKMIKGTKVSKTSKYMKLS